MFPNRLCFKNLQNTKKFTVVIMWCRFLAIAILLVVGIYKSIQRVRHESFEILQDIPLWKPSGFVAVFGNSVFLCGIHHYLPSMTPGLQMIIIKLFHACQTSRYYCNLCNPWVYPYATTCDHNSLSAVVPSGFRPWRSKPKRPESSSRPSPPAIAWSWASAGQPWWPGEKKAPKTAVPCLGGTTARFNPCTISTLQLGLLKGFEVPNFRFFWFQLDHTLITPKNHLMTLEQPIFLIYCWYPRLRPNPPSGKQQTLRHP